MDFLITLFYLLFVVCVVYPPTEVVSAGFTICQIFDNFLGSENRNFLEYQMKRISLTMFIHSLLPHGYIFCLWCSGDENPWLACIACALTLIPAGVTWTIATWWENDMKKHPVVKIMGQYAGPGGDWKQVAGNLNLEFRRVDKVCIQLSSTSKFVATETWLILATQYSMTIIRQSECGLVAVATDSHDVTPAGEEDVQFINIQAVPSRDDLPTFSFRVTAPSLRELQPRLLNPVTVPDHVTLQPTLIERFVTVFRQHVDMNPIYYVDEEPELCIGCMQTKADVKLNRRCNPAAQNTLPPCQQCNCRVLWCCSCMSRWWASRAGEPGAWLERKCTCPVCRAHFCVLDVVPVVLRPEIR